MLSTCNRTEVYAVAERFHGAYADIRDFLVRARRPRARRAAPHLYSQHDEAAVAPPVRGRRRVSTRRCSARARSSARSATRGNGTRRGQAARATLNLLFRHALEVGKRARTETGHRSRHRVGRRRPRSRWPPSALGSLAGRRVLVVGAGEMGEGMAVALADAGVAEIIVANRTVRSRRAPRRRGSAAVRFGSPSCRRARRGRRAAHLDWCSFDPGRARRSSRRSMAARPNRPLLDRRHRRAPRRRSRRARRSPA